MTLILSIDFICQRQDFLIAGDVAHAVPVVHKACDAFLVDQHLGGHAPQFEEVHLLPIELQYAGFRVWKPDEGQVFFLEVS